MKMAGIALQNGAQAKTNEAESVTLTVYWQQLKKKLQTLYFRSYPAGIDLRPHIDSLFKSVPIDERQALLASLTPAPVGQSAASAAGKLEMLEGESADASHEVDELFVRNLLITMRMALMGEELEELNVINLARRAPKLEATPKLFGDSELPMIKSPFSLALAEIFFEHGQIFASGKVHSTSALIQVGLGKQLELAQRQSEKLAAAIDKYKVSSSPINQRKKELSDALQLPHLHWVQRFEDVFLQRVLLLLDMCEPKTEQSKDLKPPHDGILTTAGLNVLWLFKVVATPVTTPLDYLRGAGAGAVEVDGDEQAEGPPPELAWLKIKAGNLEGMIARVQQSIIIGDEMKSFVTVEDTQGASQSESSQPDTAQQAPLQTVTGPAHEHHAKLNPGTLCAQYSLILRHVQSYYQKVFELIEGFENLDKFTKLYFAHCSDFHTNLSQSLSENPFEDQPGLNAELQRFCDFLPNPAKIMNDFYNHFQEQFDDPASIKQLFAAPATAADEKDVIDRIAGRLKRTLNISKMH